MSADASELDGLARAFRAIPAAMVPKLRGVVAKASLNTKTAMIADVKKSRHFRGKNKPGLDASIDYDITVNPRGGDAVIEGEIGPNADRYPAAALAGIAYFGSSKPGGGTVRDPEKAMLDEAENFYSFAFKATEGLL